MGGWLCSILIATIILVAQQFSFYKNNETTREQYWYMLQSCQRWQQDGAITHSLAPVITYPNAGDKFVTLYKRLESKTGDNYYVSYPPFAFWTTYLFFLVTCLPMNALGLQLFALFLFYSCCSLLFGIGYILANTGLKKNLFGILAVLLYCSIKSILHLHINVVFPEMIVHIFWLALIFLLLVQKKQPNPKSLFLWVAIFFLAFCTAFTEWVGFLMLVAIIFYFALLKEKKMVLVLCSAFAVALLLMLVCYASIDGIENMRISMMDRATKRSGVFNTVDVEGGISIFTDNATLLFKESLNNAIGLPLWAGLFSIILGSILFFKNKIWWLCISATLIPCLLHNILFFNFTVIHGHGFSKLSVPIAILTTLFCILCYENKKRFFLYAATILIFGTCLYQQLLSAEKKVNNTVSPTVTALANHIQTKVQPTDVIFLNSNACQSIYAPPLAVGFLIQRQIANANDTLTARQYPYLKNRSFWFFKTDENLNVIQEFYCK